jgi:hypothetical protein
MVEAFDFIQPVIFDLAEAFDSAEGEYQGIDFSDGCERDVSGSGCRAA